MAQCDVLIPQPENPDTNWTVPVVIQPETFINHCGVLVEYSEGVLGLRPPQPWSRSHCSSQLEQMLSASSALVSDVGIRPNWTLFVIDASSRFDKCHIGVFRYMDMLANLLSLVNISM